MCVCAVGGQGAGRIFGDGAGAAVVGPADRPGIGPVIWGSDPAGLHCIEQRTSWQVVQAGEPEPAVGGGGVVEALT